MNFTRKKVFRKKKLFDYCFKYNKCVYKIQKSCHFLLPFRKEEKMFEK